MSTALLIFFATGAPISDCWGASCRYSTLMATSATAAKDVAANPKNPASTPNSTWLKMVSAGGSQTARRCTSGVRDRPDRVSADPYFVSYLF